MIAGMKFFRIDSGPVLTNGTLLKMKNHNTDCEEVRRVIVLWGRSHKYKRKKTEG